jgi:hypothetical protein
MAMPQTVTMQIEYRGGGPNRHLHLLAGTEFNVSKGGGEVTLNLNILPKNAGTPTPADQRPNQVRLWFPLPVPLFFDSGVLATEITIGPISYASADNIGKAVKILTPNPDFPIVDGKKTVIPIAIYADVDEGQDPGSGRPGNRKGVFHQAGLQMVDGAESHPECNVGP